MDESQIERAIEQAHEEVSPEALKATGDLLASFERPRSRRTMLRMAALGAGLTVAGSTALTALPVHAAAASSSVVTEIFSIAATAETLAVTFYHNGIVNAGALGLHGAALSAIMSIAHEEDIHRSFFKANGGQVSTDNFSFPRGQSTFTSLRTFVETQQQLEVVFDSAFLLAVKIFAGLSGGAALAQIAAQIACVEQGHLAVGRFIAGFVPAEPYTFAPVLFSDLSQIVPAVQAAGYLSPKPGNNFDYRPAPHAFTVDNIPSGKVVLNAI